MSLRQYVQVLRARWYVVVAGLIVGGLVAGLYVGTATKTYTAHAQLFVSTSSAQESSLSDINAGGTFVQDQVKSYASVATTPTLTAPIIASLGLPYTTGQLAGEISASAPLDTVLINLTVTDRDPARAAAIANALAGRLTSYISQLETPIGQSVSPVKATVTQQAQVPTGPSSPKRKLDLALGLVVGLLIGVAIAVALETLDNRVGGHIDVAQLTHAPVVGFIGEDVKVKDRPLILLDDAFSTRAEAFRQLRTNVRFLGVDRMLRSVVVTGSVEAEGKSLTVANLAIALAQAGERVTLVDADLRRPTVATTFGLSAGVGLTSVLVGTATLAAAVQSWRDDLSLRVLTSGPIPPNPSELLGSQRLVELIAELLTECDIVLFDSPPLLPVTDAALLARVTDGALVVTRAKSTRAGQLAAAVAALRSADAQVLGIVVNRVPRQRRGGYTSYGAYGTYTPAAYEGYRPLSTPDASLPAPDLVPAVVNAHGPHPLSVVGGPRPDEMVPRPVVPGRVPVPSPLTERITLAATRAMAREQRLLEQQRTRENPPLP
jgi:succinoglycan biosynthesis transport protein ExoP